MNAEYGGWHCALAFDFGTRKIGVAVGQSATGTASPLAVLPCHRGTPDWGAIEQLLGEWQPNVLVVGLPLPADGSESALSRRARDFASELAQRTRLEVHMIDEHLSSVEERSRLHGKSDRSAKNAVDATAASVILETWLTEARSKRL